MKFSILIRVWFIFHMPTFNILIRITSQDIQTIRNSTFKYKRPYTSTVFCQSETRSLDDQTVRYCKLSFSKEAVKTYIFLATPILE
jgi:hypothetical protein